MTVCETERLDMISVAGSVDFATVDELRSLLHTRLCSEGRDVLVDLSGVGIIDARAAAELERLAIDAERNGGQLQIVGARGIVLKVLQITGAARRLGLDGQEAQLADRQLADENGGHDGLVVTLSRLAHLPPDSPARLELRDRVVTSFLPLAAQLARRFRYRGEAAEDLTQVAVIALINAVDRFDPDRGQFFPFAVTTVTGELKRHLRDRGWTVRPPRRLQELGQEVRVAEAELGQTLQRPPTHADIADYLDMPEDRVVEATMAQWGRRPASLHTPTRTADLSLADALGADDSRLDAIECWVSLRSLIADLPARTRRILEMRFRDEMTQSQIAERLGISQMHVSRLLTQTMDSLRRALQDHDTRDSPKRTNRPRIPRRSIG